MKLSFLLFFYSLIFILFSSSYAQLSQLQIEGKLEKSLTEIVSRRDANGRFCAAIQVVSDMDGFSYDSYNGIVGKIDDQAGMDIVYLTPDERVLQIFHSGYEPLKIILAEIGIQLKEKEMWIIKISGQKELGKIPVAIITQPAGAQVTIDGKNLGVVESYTLSKGQHTIRLSLTGYEPLIETIFVDESNAFLKYDLKKIQDVPMEIKSLPNGATVFIDEVKFGITPLTDFYPTGKYTIRLEKEWYVTYEDFIDIKAPNTRETFSLKEDFGSLSITSAPESGMNIYIDGKVTNYKTPYTFNRLKPATYSISAKSQYFDTDEKTITVTREGQHTTQLQSNANFATLNIVTMEGAQIYINDQLTAQRQNIRLEPQVVRVRAEKPPKGKTVEQRMVLKKNDSQTVEIFPDIPTGSIQIAVNPFEAKIELKGDAGEYYTADQSKMFDNIPAGSYELIITKDGFKTYKENLILRTGDILKHRATLIEGSDVPEDFVFVKGGTFQMGSYNGEDNEKPIHTVTIGDFYIGKYEVTQRQWMEIMGNNPSYFKGDRLPVEQVSWYDILVFIRKLNAKTGANYRLPTEAEWEYAARGGNQSSGYKYVGSNNVDEVAWYSNNSDRKTHSVGRKKPNELGLYDMSGNVWEWCQDYFDKNYYSISILNNPEGPSTGEDRVIRGGRWGNNDIYVRVANRDYCDPDGRDFGIGFRLVRDL